jgi:cytochrome c biogenesis protein CcmG, thiol:disulfide interchange protein DsbE
VSAVASPPRPAPAGRSPRRLAWVGAAVVAVLLLAALGVALFHQSAVPHRTVVGSEAPAVTVRTYDGHTVALSGLRGKPVVLNVWASWCAPCRQEASLLERTWRQQARPRGVLFVGLDMQDITTDARDFMREFAIDYLNIRDPSNTVARRYGVTGVPETFFITASSRVVGHVIGVTSPAQLRSGITAAIEGHPQAAHRGGAQGATR